MKVNVKKLKMTCQHCYEFINTDGGELLKPETLNKELE